MDRPVILIVESNQALSRKVAGLLFRQGFEVIESTGRADARLRFEGERPDLVVLGSCGESPWNALQLGREIRGSDAKVPLILATANSSEEVAIAALRAGINDYFKSPFSCEELVSAIDRCLSGRPPRISWASPIASSLIDGHKMIADSQKMLEIKAYIRKVAGTESSVVITGETGTGKELAAELIHGNSPRQPKPFVCINCAAIPENLLESELFGHERGAFTGAHSQKEGKLKLADGGTVFFDEIGDMTPYAQAKILRAIECKEVYRLGGRVSIALDVRVIAATNQDLEQLVAENKFRKDLYFRLNVARIHLPPLRERPKDIPLLIDHYIRELNRRFGREVEGVTAEALGHLISYDWPGNVRELKNLVEAVFVNLSSRRISVTDLPEQYQRRFQSAEGLPVPERERVLSALFSTNWNRSRAAQKLHWSRMTLYRKMAKYRITPARAQEATRDRDPTL